MAGVNTMAKILLIVAGLIFAAVGAISLTSPQFAVDPLGIQLTTVNSLNEIRANYGGMHLLLGLFLVAGAFRIALQKPALFLLTFFTGGLVLGRVVSLVVDGVPGNTLWAFLILETLGCLWALTLLIKMSRGKLVTEHTPV